MKRSIRLLTRLLAAASLAAAPRAAMASSHMDAPLITLDPAANTTDVTPSSRWTTASRCSSRRWPSIPFEEPGIGPNKYNFDDDVLYEIHVAAGNDDVQAGRATYSYQFRFNDAFKNTKHDPPVLPGRHPERGRRGAEPDPALHA